MAIFATRLPESNSRSERSGYGILGFFGRAKTLREQYILGGLSPIAIDEQALKAKTTRESLRFALAAAGATKLLVT